MIPLLLALAGAESPRYAEIVTGDGFTCARDSRGAVRCWGLNDDHQLGTTTEGAYSREPVEPDGATGATDLAAADGQGCATLQSGELRCWGRVSRPGWGSGELPRRRKVSNAAAVAVGPARGCVRQRSAGLNCWEQTPRVPPLDLTNVRSAQQIGVGLDHACALVQGGNVWCWGATGDGVLGAAAPGSLAPPLQVEGVFEAVDLSVGARTSCAVTRSGTVLCWGANEDGQLGLGHTRPVEGAQQVPGVLKAVEVSVGPRNACARTVEGQVFCWGAASCAGADRPTHQLEPTDLGLRDVDALADGPTSEHRCALVEGDAACWGPNAWGQADPSDDRACVPRP